MPYPMLVFPYRVSLLLSFRPTSIGFGKRQSVVLIFLLPIRQVTMNIQEQRELSLIRSITSDDAVAG